MKNIQTSHNNYLTNNLVIFFLILHIAIFYFFHFNHSVMQISYFGDNYSNIFDSINYEQYSQDKEYIDSFLANDNFNRIINDNTLAFKHFFYRILKLMPYASSVFLHLTVTILIFFTFIINIVKFNLKNKDFFLVLLFTMLPSFNYWSSYVSKTSLILIAINLIFILLLNIYLFRKITISSLLCFFLGFLILYFLKQHYIYLISYLIINLIFFSIFNTNKYLLTLILCFFNFGIILSFFFLLDTYTYLCDSGNNFNIICSLNIKQFVIFLENFNSISDHYKYGNTTRDISFLNFNHFLIQLPYNFYLSFFGPTFFEIDSIVLLYFYFEKVFLITIILLLLYDKNILQIYFINFFFITILLTTFFLIFSFSYTAQSIWNIGSGNRYRSEIFYPFVYFVVLYKRILIKN